MDSLSSAEFSAYIQKLVKDSRVGNSRGVKQLNELHGYLQDGIYRYRKKVYKDNLMTRQYSGVRTTEEDMKSFITDAASPCLKNTINKFINKDVFGLNEYINKALDKSNKQKDTYVGTNRNTDKASFNRDMKTFREAMKLMRLFDGNKKFFIKSFDLLTLHMVANNPL